MKKKLSIISLLLLLPACANQGLTPVINPSASSSVTVISSGVRPVPTDSGNINPTPTPIPTAYPLPANTNFNRKIVFLSDYEGSTNLYSINADGTNRTKLGSINRVSSITYPVISPDGTKVIFNNQNENSLYSVNSDGTHSKKLYPLGNEIPGLIIFTNLSRDGKMLVFSDEQRLTVMNLETTETKSLNLQNVSYPYFSPDGKKIVFVMETGPQKNYQLYTVDSDGNNLRRLTNDSSFYYYPQWSPDGTRIIVSLANTNNPDSGGIYLIKPDGTDPQPIVLDSTYKFSLSPNGEKIAYSVRKLSSVDVKVINTDGTNNKTIINLESDNYPIWSPDSKTLAYINKLDLYTINPDGSSLRKLTNDFTQGKAQGVISAIW